MVLFTRNVKKIRVIAHKYGDIDDTCKRALNVSLLSCRDVNVLK